MLNNKYLWRIIAFSALFLTNLVALYVLFGLLHQFDTNPPAKWIELVLVAVGIFFAPVIYILSLVDESIRLPDYWYILGVLVNAFFWAACMLFLASFYK